MKRSHPVVVGMSRAAGTSVDQARTSTYLTLKSVMQILIHGDASFSGQGLVAETFNLITLTGILDRWFRPHHRQ